MGTNRWTLWFWFCMHGTLKVKENTAWVEMWSISNKNRNDLNASPPVLLLFFLFFFGICGLNREFRARQQTMYWSLNRHRLGPTHPLPADTVLSDPTPSIVLFHTASIPFTSTSLALYYPQPVSLLLKSIFFSAICPSRTLVFLLFISFFLHPWFFPQSPPPPPGLPFCFLYL